MKTLLKEYIKNIVKEAINNVINESSLLTEHFVNCTNKEEMQQYKYDVWDILQRSYAYCGGIKNVDSVDDLIDDTYLWKLFRKNGKIIAAICYTDRKGGRKMCLMGSDGTPEGRTCLKKMMEDDFELEERNSWVGASGKALITMLKHGAKPVPANVAIKFMGNKCIPVDKYWYKRPIINSEGEVENHMKVMVGNPPGYEHEEIPQSVINDLIQKAIEYGE